ncbi:hypothetical protein LMG31506_05665 [Cupriavidus yeoncheonensis]|uniref:Polysaccharide biosynthesis protein C-terminal domain-containing protein n=1 Tax=Cupriavidus yeoncheonensis TaxID=1462994 RepID=A0A916J059_9BURK|nr:oligosaccharide flippase family protein [Cupriavidus yeoncheonensis]CAG2156303.1 hypothetical protein LMG31506_05665 [Cupriavidus yeoncheonensis]
MSKIDRDYIFSFLSIAARTVGGLTVFIANARIFGPEQFGVLMSWFAVAAFLAILPNFGVVPVILRDCAKAIDGGFRIVSDLLNVKLCLTAATVPFAILLSAILPDGVVFGLLSATHIADTYIDFFLAVLRARGKFRYEAVSYSIYSALSLIFIILVGYLSTSLELVALSFFLSRLAFAIVLMARVTQLYEDKFRLLPIRRSLFLAKSHAGYLIDLGLQSAMVNLDSTILRIVAGPYSVGLYQAGTKIAYGFCTAIGVISNVMIPRNSRRFSEGDRIGVIKSITWGFLSVGLALGVTNYGVMTLLMPKVYGDHFSSIIVLAPILSAFLVARFIASGFGIILVLANEARARILALSVSVAVLVCGCAWLGARYGAVGAAATLLASTLVTAGLMLVAVNQTRLSSVCR